MQDSAQARRPARPDTIPYSARHRARQRMGFEIGLPAEPPKPKRQIAPFFARSESARQSLTAQAAWYSGCSMIRVPESSTTSREILDRAAGRAGNRRHGSHPFGWTVSHALSRQPADETPSFQPGRSTFEVTARGQTSKATSEMPECKNARMQNIGAFWHLCIPAFHA